MCNSSDMLYSHTVRLLDHQYDFNYSINQATQGSSVSKNKHESTFEDENSHCDFLLDNDS